MRDDYYDANVCAATISSTLDVARRHYVACDDALRRFAFRNSHEHTHRRIGSWCDAGVRTHVFVCSSQTEFSSEACMF